MTTSSVALDPLSDAYRAEIAGLQSRLEEAEETLRAIRSGEVDAITVTTPAGQQVFSLRGVEQPYRVMVETMSEGAVTVSVSGTVLYCNQRFADMVRADLRTILGSPLLGYFGAEGATKVAAALGESATRTHRISAQLVTSDVAMVPVNIAISRLDGGVTQRAVIVVSDLTEVMAAQQETAKLNQHLEELVSVRTDDLAQSNRKLVAANEKLQAINEELGTFSYSVSHDLRTPLRAIDGFTRKLMEDHASKLDQEGLRVLNIVLLNTVKMSRLIDDILAFSRLGRLELHPAEVDMEAIAFESYKALEQTVGGRAVEFKIGALPKARVDAGMIRQVFANLLDNAIKYSAKKPNTMIEIEGHIDADEAIYVVRDNGAGFDMRYVGKLFGVFQRLHGPSEFSGTGIGLSIVKRIITRHGGRVWAEATPNEGASFYFALPRTEALNARAA